jgi:hypothetical protein
MQFLCGAEKDLIHSSQSWNRSGRTGQDRTKSSSSRTKPDFCQFDIKNEPDGFYRIFSIFLPDFLPDFCRIFVSLTSKMNRTDFNRTGPDRTGPDRTEPDGKNPSGSNSDSCSLTISKTVNILK